MADYGKLKIQRTSTAEAPRLLGAHIEESSERVRTVLEQRGTT